jgi:hypothetical protein
MFRDNLSVLSSRVKKSKKKIISQKSADLIYIKAEA